MMSAKEQKGSIDVIIDFCHAYISLDNSKPSVLGMNARKNENGARSCDYHYKSKVRVKGEIILCTLTLFDSSHMLKYRVSAGAETVPLLVPKRFDWIHFCCFVCRIISKKHTD